MKPLRLPGLLALNAYWVGLAFLWNGLHAIILPAVLLNYAPEELKNTYLGLLTFVGLVIAMVIQPISGALSDRWVSNWGRRRPLILIGTLFDFGFLGILGWFRRSALAGDRLLRPPGQLQPGPWPYARIDARPVAVQPARRWQRYKNLMDMLGLILSSLFLGRLMDPNAAIPTQAIIAVILVLAISAAITLLGRAEKPVPLPEGLREGRHSLGIRSILVSIAASIRHMPPDFAWLLRAWFTFLLAFTASNPSPSTISVMCCMLPTRPS